MLNRIIQFSLHNRLLVMAASILLLFLGAYTASNMEVDVFPDLTAPTVVVLTEAHGMAPEEVERLVTFPVETAVNGAENVRRVRSSSSAGISIVWVEFNWGTEIYRARQIVSEKMSVVANQLPFGVSAPVMAPQSSIMGEIMLISVTGTATNKMDVRTISDWNIRPLLLSIGGVSQVVVIGGEFKQFQILASPQKMNYYNVSLNELLKASEEANQNAAGGFMSEYSNEYIVRGIGRTNDLNELGRSVIKTVNGVPIKIEDVAEIKIGSAIKIGDGSLKGNPAVIMTVMKQPGTNTLELTDKIDKALIELKKTLPPDLQINTQIFRQADFIKASIGNIQKTLWEGSLFVVIILFLFLMNWRPTVISLIAIPVSLLTAILVLKWFGFTINTMSLGGMAIAIGALVDDAIIDVENVFRRLKQDASTPAEERQNKLEVIFNASVEIRTSIINATFIIITAFVPLFFLSGMEGRLLAPLGIAFIVSLFASLIIAVTLTPVLCSYLLTNEKMLQRQHKESWLVRKLNAAYERTLIRAMKHKKLIIATALALFIGAMLLFTTLGRSFLPEFNEGSLVVSVTSLPGISLEESNKIGANVEKTLLTIPEVRITTRRTGRAELDEHAQGVNASEIDAPFVLKDRDREEFMKEVRDKLAGVSGANITIGQPIGHRIDHMLSGTRANIAIKIFGTDLSTLFTLSNQIKTSIEGTEGLVDLSVEQQVQIPQVQIKANRDMLSKYGITIGEFAEFTDVAFAGEKVSEVYEGSQRFDMVLRFDESNRGNLERISNTLIDAGDGQKIPLNYVANIVSTTGPNTINRENVQRKTVVSANVAGRDQKSVVDEIRQKIESNIKLPEGYRIEYGGQFEAEAEASKTLVVTSLLALFVIFFLLYQEFKNIKISSIILLNLPLALIGGVLSVWLTSGMLSIPAIIGFITLFGIATRNGILLVSHYQTLTNEGMPLYDTIIQGSKDRLSPILMTALTAGLALIPLAMGGELPGNEIQSPMAKVILGGLLSSTLLNLFVVPVVYFLANRKTEKIKALRLAAIFNSLRQKEFAKLYAAQTVSLLGDAFTWVGIALLAFEFGGENSAAILSTALTLRVTAFILIAPYAGVMADKLNRRKILLIADFGRMALVAFLAFVDAEWQIYLIVFFLNVFSAFFTPSFKASIPQMIKDKEKFAPAIALSNATYQVLAIMGPGIAGIAATWLGSREIFLADSISYLSSALLVLAISRTLFSLKVNTEKSQINTGKWKEVFTGTMLLFKDRVIRFALFIELTAAIVGANILVNTVGYVKGILAQDDKHYGWVMSALGVGAAIGAFGAAILDKSKTRKWSLIIGGLIVSLAVLPANHASFYLLIFLWLVAGFGQNLAEMPSQMLIAERIPLEQQGRVYGAHFAWSHLWWAIGYPIAGFLGSRFKNTSFVIAGCLAISVLVIVLLTHTFQKQINEK